MKLAFTLHRVGLGKGTTADPGQVLEMTDKNYTDMLRFGAVREPTADEQALYRLANPDDNTGVSPELVRAEVIARAEELGLEFKKNIGTVKLAERVLDAEKATGDLLG